MGERRSAVQSIVVDYGPQSSTCGYCRSNEETSFSHGASAKTLSVEDYQALLDRGWRRSGCYLYKPALEKSCCPSYTIRLKADAFLLSKEHIKVLKRMERYLSGEYSGPSHAEEKREEADASEAMVAEPSVSVKDRAELSLIADLEALLAAAIKSCIMDGGLPAVANEDVASLARVRRIPDKVRHQLGPSELRDGGLGEEFTSSAAFVLSAKFRSSKAAVRKKGGKESTMQHEEGPGGGDAAGGPSPQDIAATIAGALAVPGRRVMACKGHVNFSCLKGGVGGAEVDVPGASTRSNAGGTAYRDRGRRKSQGGEEVAAQGKEKMRVTPRTLEISMKRSSFDTEEYELYRKYQMVVHNDNEVQVQERRYRGFLVDSPLRWREEAGLPSGFGAFHQQYRIDGKLVAVGVVDILPGCLSSKYLFWDPDYAFLSLGKFAALKEIEWVQLTTPLCPSLQYYYLGYYIHSCPKMRYKAAYTPSELLCPVTYKWVPHSLALPLLEADKFAVLSRALLGEDRGLEEEDRARGGQSSVGERGRQESVDGPQTGTSGESEVKRKWRGKEVVEGGAVGQKAWSGEEEEIETAIAHVPLLMDRHLITFEACRSVGFLKGNEHLVKENLRTYCRAVGPKLAPRMAYKLF